MTILAFAISIGISFSQDMILKKTGDEIAAKVSEISPKEIKYKNFDNLDGPIHILSKSEVFMIRYENGSKDIFTEEEVEKSFSASGEDLSAEGQRDATLHYTGKRSGAAWVVTTTVLFTPLVGIIPALVCQSTKPSYRNLDFPDSARMEDDNYNIAYTRKAHQAKKKKIWKSFGISSGAWLVLILLL